jgi:hypothetical protein
MSDKITSVAMPPSITAGEKFRVTVDYTADEAGTVAIRYVGTFDGDPDTVDLPANQQRVQFDMTIVRYGGTSPSCRVEYRFGNKKTCVVDVT